MTYCRAGLWIFDQIWWFWLLPLLRGWLLRHSHQFLLGWRPWELWNNKINQFFSWKNLKTIDEKTKASKNQRRNCKNTTKLISNHNVLLQNDKIFKTTFPFIFLQQYKNFSSHLLPHLSLYFQPFFYKTIKFFFGSNKSPYKNSLHTPISHHSKFTL